MLEIKKTEAAVSDPSEIYLNVSMIIENAATEKITGIGLIAKATPSPAATPFPPLNFKNGLNILPIIKVIPKRRRYKAGVSKRFEKQYVVKKAFPVSITRTRLPKTRPAVLNTLVNPIFPLP